MSYAVCTKLDWWIGVCCAVLGFPSFMADLLIYVWCVNALEGVFLVGGLVVLVLIVGSYEAVGWVIICEGTFIQVTGI